MKSGIKQNIVIGSDFLTDLRKLKVLMVNMNWTSIEIARNLCLLNIGMITLFDKALVTEPDLVMAFIFKQEDIGTPKANAVMNWLQPMCVSTLVEKNTSDLNETQGPIKDHDVVILTDAGSFVAVKRTEELSIKMGKKFVYVSTNELYAAAFFNFLFIESRVRFSHINSINVVGLTYAKKGVLTLSDRHPFQRCDFISVEGLEDTKGFSNEEIRPVVRVVDDYSIEIEDTSKYTKIGEIEKGTAVVSGVNYPYTHKAKSVQEQMAMTEKDFEFFNPRLSGGFRFIGPYLIYRDAVKSGKFASKEMAFDSLYLNDSAKKSCDSYKQSILSRDVDKPRRLLPLENSLIAGLVSFEILKTNGLYLPQKAPLFLPALSMDFLFEKRLMIFGCGAKTHEFLKILFIEAQIRKREYRVSVFDDHVITTDHSKNYFFATHTSINMTKSACVVKEVNARKGYLKVTDIDRSQSYKAVINSDIVIITFDSYLTAYEFADMATCNKKPVFLLTEHLGEFFSLHLTETNLPILEKYFVNTNDYRKAIPKGIDIPESTADVARWASLLFEIVFEHFIVNEGEIFKNANRNAPFYSLVLLMKGQFYDFLLNQSPKESNLVLMAVIFFKIIFTWYVEQMAKLSSDTRRSQLKIHPVEFKFDEPLHQEFVVSFVGMFKGVFVPAAPKMDDKSILDHLKRLMAEPMQKIADLSPRQIEESYRANLRKMIKSEKYFRTYKIRHDLVEFEKVRGFANVLYQTKLLIFDLKSKNKNEFEYYFFNEQWSLPTDGAMLAGLLINHISRLGDETFPPIMSIDPSNCKSTFF